MVDAFISETTQKHVSGSVIDLEGEKVDESVGPVKPTCATGNLGNVWHCINCEYVCTTYLQKINFIYTSIEVVCRDPTKKQVVLQLPSAAAVAMFNQQNACLPKEPRKFATKLLDVFFTEAK